MEEDMAQNFTELNNLYSE